MIYNEYLKQKIINLYLNYQKIGKHSISNNDYDFLNIYFDNKTEIKSNVYAVSEILQYIISDYKTNYCLHNKFGIDFLEHLKEVRINASIFLQQTPLLTPQINSTQKQDLEQKYTKVANQYGLKEFYYTLNPNLSPNENYDKAILLLDKTCVELEKIKKHLNIQESSKIGNGILSIQVNWQEEPQNNGYYNFCSNTICLKDERSTFPLVHEYIHFLDKTTACLLLTGKNSQQLYEEELFSQKELFNNFDMSVFSKIEFKKENFPWIDVIKLKILFKEEITQNQYIQGFFNYYDKNKDYTEEFKNIISEWIEEENYPNKDLLKQDINELLINKETKFNSDNKPYSNEEKNIIIQTMIFNTFLLNMNNAKNWSEEFDVKMSKIYYSSQKEMLARTVEQSINGKLEQLSDRLTTPVLNSNEQTQLFNILKSWQSIISFQDKQQVSDRIKNIRIKLEQKPELISHFKIK